MMNNKQFWFGVMLPFVLSMLLGVYVRFDLRILPIVLVLQFVASMAVIFGTGRRSV